MAASEQIPMAANTPTRPCRSTSRNDASAFKAARNLAAYAGIAPITHHSGTGAEHPALICLARRRCDVLFAMLRTKTHYQAPQAWAA
jgi:transposase